MFDQLVCFRLSWIRFVICLGWVMGSICVVFGIVVWLIFCICWVSVLVIVVMIGGDCVFMIRRIGVFIVLSLFLCSRLVWLCSSVLFVLVISVICWVSWVWLFGVCVFQLILFYVFRKCCVVFLGWFVWVRLCMWFILVFVLVLWVVVNSIGLIRVRLWMVLGVVMVMCRVMVVLMLWLIRFSGCWISVVVCWVMVVWKFGVLVQLGFWLWFGMLGVVICIRLVSCVVMGC